MTVRELIDKLLKFDGGKIVVVEDINCDHMDVDGVRKGEENDVILDIIE